MSRFFVAPEDVGGGIHYHRKQEDLHHMNKVLRLKAGDEIDVSDGDMWGSIMGRFCLLSQSAARWRSWTSRNFRQSRRQRSLCFRESPLGQDGADRAESRGAGCLRDRTGVCGSDGSDG